MNDLTQTTDRPRGVQFVWYWGWVGFGLEEVPENLRPIYRRLLALGPLEIRWWA